ncbi:hypothetical protein MO867_21375 [Microbulbifer sp. OS29]|uniref:O-methyltransferase n=1 Tax=Microbulbifer okhotskensis TaxID=2926617 RepID=A0A9X2J773_9GAMM|nr:methyltransferase [Microbulbifer okhotskensis]MCO1336883.1 hypothetical protein [Microbulbifer okhotskensis]
MPKSLQRNKISNWMFQQLSGAISRFSNISSNLIPPSFRLMQMGSLFWQSRCLYVAARLDIAEYVGDEAVSIQKLAVDCKSDEDYLYRLMRMLSAMGVFKETKARHFAHNRNSYVLRSDSDKSVKNMILMHNSPEFSRPWFMGLEGNIQKGRVPFECVNGKELFAYMDENQEVSDIFSNAMDTVDHVTGLKYLDDFDWEKFDRIIDLGGAKGSKSAGILSSYKHLRSLVVDRANVESLARAYWRDHVEKNIEERLDFYPADILNGRLPCASGDKDIYLCVAVFHLLSDSVAQQFLESIHKAMGGCGGTLAIADAMLPEKDADLTLAAMDIQMLMGTRGRERTIKEWNQLFDKSPLYLVEVVNVRSFAKIMVLKPRKLRI